MAYEIFADSFDTSADLSSSRWGTYTTTTNYITIVPGEGRRGTSALRFWPGSLESYIQTKELTPSTHCVCGFSYKTSNPIQSATEIEFQNSSTVLVKVNILTTGKLSVTLGGTTYTSNNALVTGTTNHIQIGTIIGDSGYLEVRVNGANTGWLSLSNVDTKPSTQTNITNIRLTKLGFSGQPPTYIDDFWITYGDELKWLGDVCIDALSLTGNDTRQDWVPDTGNAWERLNQSAGNVKSNIIGAESYFELANTTSTYSINSVEGIIINATAKKDGANTRAFAITANSNNVIVTGNTNYLGESYVEYRTPLVLNPNGNTAWTKESINNLKVGVKVIE